jgi:AsmA-like C-terminal region
LKRAIKYIVRGLLWVFGIIAAIWIGLLIYVSLNEQKFINQLSALVNDITKGQTHIKHLSVSLFRTFPILSLQLKDVVVTDSLFARHHQELLKASDVYLKLSLSALIHGKPGLGKIVISNGSLSLYVDSAGEGNTYVMKSADKQPADKSGKLKKFPEINLSNILFTYTNISRNKLYQADINDLNCTIRDDSAQTALNANLDIVIRHLEFNTKKGSFARDKRMEGKLALIFDKSKKSVIARNMALDINDHEFVFDGSFNIEKETPDFALQITTTDIEYDEAVSLLSDAIKKKLTRYGMSKPLSIKVQLEGQTVYKTEPRVEVWADVAHTDIKAPQGLFTDCSFKGYCTNEMVKGDPRADANSTIRLENFSSSWEDIPFTSKKVKIYDFQNPILECDIEADVDMRTINKVSGSTTLKFQKGKTEVDINYKGPIDADNMSIPDIDGQVKISDAEVKYLPRNILFDNLNGLLIFKDHDLAVKKIGASVGSTRLEMSGYAKSLLSLLITSPEKLETRWEIQSPQIRLEDFTTFLQKSKDEISEAKKNSKRAEFSKAASRVDKMMQEGEVFMKFTSPAMTYKNFKATDVHAEMILKKFSLQLQKASFKHADGTMEITGSLTNGVGVNPIEMHTRMTNMNIPLLFKAFDNFGQDALTHDNLSGRLSADINLNSQITDKAKMVTSSSKGTIDFLLEDGELNHFEPLQRAGEKVFKKQNFDEIKFADMKNRLDVTGTTFIINPMEIRSTAMTFFVEGVYDVKKGSDMSIQMPLNNLTKSQANTVLNTDVKKKKGVSLRLRARTGNDGKLKLSWDPFRRSIHNRNEVRDSTGKD